MPKIIKQDAHTATIQLDDPHRPPITIAKRNPDGTHNSTYMAFSHHDEIRGYADGGEVKKQDDDDTSDRPAQVSGGYAKGGRVGYADGGEVAPSQVGAPPPVIDQNTDAAPPISGGAPSPTATIPVSAAVDATAPMSAPSSAAVPQSADEPRLPGTQQPVDQPSSGRNIPMMTKTDEKDTTQNKGYDQSLIDTLTHANRDEAIKAQEGLVGAQVKGYDAASKNLSDQAKVERDAATQSQTYATNAQSWEDQYKQTMQKNMDAYQQAKIVPKSIFESGNLGQNIAAGLSLAMGALGGALTGTHQNVALDIMNKAIDRDLEAQKFNLEKQGQVTNMLGMYYKTALDMGKTTQEAKEIATKHAMADVVNQGMAAAAQSQSGVAQAGMAQFKAKADEQATREALEFTQASSTHEVNHMTGMSPLVGDPTPENQAKLQQMENDTALMHDFSNMVNKNNLAGPAKARLQGALSRIGLASNNWEQAQAIYSHLSQDQIEQISSRFGPEVQGSVKNTLASVNKPLPQFNAQVDEFDKNMSNQYYNLAGTAPYPLKYQYKHLGTKYDLQNAKSYGVALPGAQQQNIPFKAGN